MKGPHQISLERASSTESLSECPMMRPHDRIFDLPENMTGGAKLRAEHWFNESLTLGTYVGGAMDLGCQCNVRYDSQEWYPTCKKMLVAGAFESERTLGEGHYDDHDGDDKPSALDILRYMGGGVMLFFMVPGLYVFFHQRSAQIRKISNFFSDWMQRGIVQRVVYFPGSKHAQPRLTLHLPPTNTGMMAYSSQSGAPGIQMAVMQQPIVHAPVIQPSRGGESSNISGNGVLHPQIATGVVVSSSAPVLVPHQQQTARNQVAPLPVPVAK